MQSQKALLILEDGSEFLGDSIGASGQVVGEVVFNTAMTGYQEILTDPSYACQLVVLTHPHIGNVGVNSDDAESDKVHAAAMLIRDLPPHPSNWRSEMSISAWLAQFGCVAIAGIDTRRLTRKLREKGSLRGCLQAGRDIDSSKALAEAQAFPGLKGMDLASKVTTAKPYGWHEGLWRVPPREKHKYLVVCYDFGIKRNLLRHLYSLGCHLKIVPAQTPFKETLAMQPDGILLSNGPGDPEPCDYAIHAIQAFLERGIPLLGICLGHQLLALAAGGRIRKMKFGHHGANHPVREISTGRISISSQNHCFVVDADDFPDDLEVTHVSLFDSSIQGIRHRHKPALGFQGHPEASPGPSDMAGIFKQFIELMQASGSV
ncbi:MAG: glutamine-hydrolyzing carbamoyl-phosphate synthase small subunit [Candidatus Eutrophobiaceae bacterium]